MVVVGVEEEVREEEEVGMVRVEVVVEVVGVGSLVVLPSSVAGIPTLDEPLRLLPGRHLALGRNRTLHPGRTAASQLVG